MTLEVGLMWVAVLGYAGSTALHIASAFFNRAVRAVTVVTSAGAVAHAASIVLRWVRVGHGPYLGFYEVASLMAFISVAMLLWMVWRWPGLKAVGVAVMPIAFLMLGGSLLASDEASAVTGALVSVWLGIHVIFANLAYGSYLVAFALAVAFLLRDAKRLPERVRAVVDRFPDSRLIDGLTMRFVGAGFILQGVMIASGAIWANEAWGRYWGWDPMEVWCLLAWLVYAVYLHMTLTLGWRGRRAAWVVVIALPVIVFSLLGVPLLYDSIHGAYLKL